MRMFHHGLPFAFFALATIGAGSSALSASGAELIPSPRLMPGAGKAAGCLESAMRLHFSPGESIDEWKGPGVRADGAGNTDPSTALYVFRLKPTGRWFGLAFYSPDDRGWRLFTFTNEEGQLQIGYRAATLDPVAHLFEVRPHSFAALSPKVLGDDVIPDTEIDISGCAESLTGP